MKQMNRTEFSNWKYLPIVALFLSLMIASCTRSGDGGSNHEQANGIDTTNEVDAEQRVRELGLTLRPMGEPTNNFVTAVQAGDMLYLSGRGPVMDDGEFMRGKVGIDLTVEEGYEAARLTGVDLLAALKSELGDLNRVVRIVKVLGVVNSSLEFEQHPQVINGFSDLMVDVFGERGRHARSALGMGSLPFGIPVEIEMIVQIRD